MRKSLNALYSVLFAVCILVFSNASVTKAQETITPALNWTGFYIGAGAGTSWTDFDIDTAIEGISKTRVKRCYYYYCMIRKRRRNFSENFSLDEEQNNFFGTIQLGFDQQIANFFVIGAFIDADKYFGSSESFSATETGPKGGSISLSGTLDMDYSATVGARFGVLINPATLVYGLVGYTYLKLDTDQTLTINAKHASHTVSLDMPDELDGITVGAGVQTKISPATSFKFEYRYTNFENDSESSSFSSRSKMRKRYGYHNFKKTVQRIKGSSNTELDADMHSVRAVLIFHIPPL